MVLEISLGELYTAIEEDPDLRRLGPYKIVAEEGQTILPIDVNVEGRDLHFGQGDFTDGFVALCDTKAKGIDFGESKFIDLYLDNIVTETILFSDGQASRLYFDYARMKECHFGNFIAPEVYFDLATIETIFGENLTTGNIYVEKLNSPNFKPENLKANAHRLTFGVGKEASSEATPAINGNVDGEAKVISRAEFLHYLSEDPDLRRLGKYRVVAEDDEVLEINLDLEGKVIDFGNGDFTELKTLFGSTSAEVVDFSNSKFGIVDFSDAKIGDCFFADFVSTEAHFGNSNIHNVFWERGQAHIIYLENLQCNQFNINTMETDELHLGEAHIKEMFLSVGKWVKNMYCEHAKLDLLNLHEGRLEILDFGESEIRKALVNKAHIGIIEGEHLKSELLYIGNDGKNEIGELRLGMHSDVEKIELEEALRPWIDVEAGEKIDPEKERVVIREIRFNR